MTDEARRRLWDAVTAKQDGTVTVEREDLLALMRHGTRLEAVVNVIRAQVRAYEGER